MQAKVKKCLDEGKNGGERHQGLKRIRPSHEKVQEHITKAIHNLEAIQDFYNIGYSDWSASTAFYALYHGLLAILAQHGYESRNQSCTFAIIGEMISNGEVKTLNHVDLKEIFDKDVTNDIEHSSKILDIRERMQYSTKTILAEEEFSHLKARAKELFDKIRLEIERDKKA